MEPSVPTRAVLLFWADKARIPGQGAADLNPQPAILRHQPVDKFIRIPTPLVNEADFKFADIAVRCRYGGKRRSKQYYISVLTSRRFSLIALMNAR